MKNFSLFLLLSVSVIAPLVADVTVDSTSKTANAIEAGSVDTTGLSDNDSDDAEDNDDFEFDEEEIVVE